MDPDLDRGQGLNASRFWNWFVAPGALWIALLFAVPLFLVLALSFGHVDDFGRGVYGFEFSNYQDVFDSTYVPVLGSRCSQTKGSSTTG
jgi:ABC-type spermidine/putrescine transport system permease subunit I